MTWANVRGLNPLSHPAAPIASPETWVKMPVFHMETSCLSASPLFTDPVLTWGRVFVLSSPLNSPFWYLCIDVTSRLRALILLNLAVSIPHHGEIAWKCSSVPRVMFTVKTKGRSFILPCFVFLNRHTLILCLSSLRLLFHVGCEFFPPYDFL